MSDGERGYEDTATTSAAYDDDDEDYEEPDGGNRFLGFMFGNVDDAGDLDADYLDEDAKEHLFVLADKLGPSLLSPIYYDEKVEDAVDYEAIDEQYDGPEVEAATEEEHLLSKKDYFSSNTMFASVSSEASVRHNPLDVVSHVQIKTPGKRLVTKVSFEVPETEGPESIEKIKPVKFKCGAPEKSLERNIPVAGSLVSDKRTMDATDLKSTGKVGKIKIFSNIKSEDYPPDTPKPSVVIRAPAEAEKDAHRKKVIIKQPKGHVDQQRAIEIKSDQEPRKIRKIAELSSFEKANTEEDHWYAGEPSQMYSA